MMMTMVTTMIIIMMKPMITIKMTIKITDMLAIFSFSRNQSEVSAAFLPPLFHEYSELQAALAVAKVKDQTEIRRRRLRSVGPVFQKEFLRSIFQRET